MKLFLNEMLEKAGIDPATVLLLRHRPPETRFQRDLPMIAANHPHLFNAYQQVQSKRLERSFSSSRYVASFIAQKGNTAIFVGLYGIGATRDLPLSEFWTLGHYEQLRSLGMVGVDDQKQGLRLFSVDLTLTPHLQDWKGKLLVEWPKPGIVWCRRAGKTVVPIKAILEDSVLVPPLPDWRELEVGGEELKLLPTSWSHALKQWRGVYYIFDESDGKGYVGSASGAENIYARWEHYAKSGHGGDVLLKERDPRNFRFSVLELVAPSMPAKEVVRLENSWKARLHTRGRHGLNKN